MPSQYYDFVLRMVWYFRRVLDWIPLHEIDTVEARSRPE